MSKAHTPTSEKQSKLDKFKLFFEEIPQANAHGRLSRHGKSA